METWIDEGAAVLRRLFGLAQIYKYSGAARDDFAANNAKGLEFVTTESLAKALGLMQNVMGNFAFPGISASGGALLGDKLHAGGNIGAGDLILLKPSDIYKIGDRGVEVTLSTEAAVQMDDAAGMTYPERCLEAQLS